MEITCANICVGVNGGDAFLRRNKQVAKPSPVLDRINFWCIDRFLRFWLSFDSVFQSVLNQFYAILGQFRLSMAQLWNIFKKPSPVFKDRINFWLIDRSEKRWQSPISNRKIRPFVCQFSNLHGTQNRVTQISAPKSAPLVNKEFCNFNQFWSKLKLSR